MNKQDIKQKVSAKLKLTQTDVGNVLNETFGLMQEALIAGEKITIVNFGTFESAISPARQQPTALNGGGVINIKPNGKVKFKASRNLKTVIAEEGRAPTVGS